MKAYKIFNIEKKHHGIQYTTGVVEDILPFNPTGDCESGGIYFAKEDILAFLFYGPYIAEVELLEDSLVYENPKTPKKYKANKLKIKKFKKITLKVIKQLVDEGADIHADNDAALRLASYYGHLDVVKYLESLS